MTLNSDANPDDTGAETTATDEPNTDQGVNNADDGDSQTDGNAADTGDDSTEGKAEYNFEEVMSNYSDLTIPEDLDQAVLDNLAQELAPLFHQMDATPEAAQAILDHRLSLMDQESQDAADAWNGQLKAWEDEIAADKAIGGENLEQSKGLVDAVFKQFGGDEVKEILGEIGLIQQPEVFRLFRAIGAALQEDNPGGGQRHSEKPKDRVQTLYPNS